MGSDMVKCEDLSVLYNNQYGIKKNLNINIAEGSTCAIVGKSGCGKKPLYSMLLLAYALLVQVKLLSVAKR